MIQLHPDYLYFETAQGKTIPCSAELVTVELIGDSASSLDPDLIRQAAAAVLHYFKNDLHQTSVSVAEFSLALERVLKGFGLNVSQPETECIPQGVVRLDLRKLAVGSGSELELAFFANLRRELKNRLKQTPNLVHFDGLRDCVKRLTGAKRWNTRCQELSDQIVTFLRQCLECEPDHGSCGLMVQ